MGQQQDWLYNFGAQSKMKMQGALVEMLGILRQWQQSIQPCLGPLLAKAMCDCAGHTHKACPGQKLRWE